MKNILKLYRCAVIGIVLPVLLLLPAEAQQARFDDVDLQPLETTRKEGHPKMDSVLYRLAGAYAAGGPEEAQEFARMRGIDMTGDLARIVLEAHIPGNNALAAQIAAIKVKSRVLDVGGRVETSFRQSVQAAVPVHSLRRLADLDSVRYIRRPFKPHTTATSEGLMATGAGRWTPLTPFHTTESVKVCILDSGFMYYQDLLGTELPDTVTTKSFRTDGNIEGSYWHGTACAEIVHDMAPNAELYLVNFETFTELQNAVNWIGSQGVRIISYSMGSYIGGRGDGTGTACAMVEAAYDNGITWITSSGNAAQDHWQGDFADPDGDGWHNFSGNDEVLIFKVPAYQVVSAYLKWDDWGAWDGYNYGGSNQDYDMYLYYYDGSNWVYIDGSTNSQTGTQWPAEALAGWYSDTTTEWGIAIYKEDATKTPLMDLYIPTHYGDIQYNVPAGSLTSPADSPHIISVGAIGWSDFEYHSYSSRGPTLDGRIKPDICAPSGVTTSVFGTWGFYGTSAACPHLAGAIALLQGNTPFSLSQVLDIIENRAQDLGPVGKDNQYGIGRLKLD